MSRRSDPGELAFQLPEAHGPEVERPAVELLQVERGAVAGAGVVTGSEPHALADLVADRLAGQAISYKVGERVWLGARDSARARADGSFDLKEFHRAALDLGPMGLAQLETELARI